MSERIKIEDMTLGQIKDLKKEISKEVNDYLNSIAKLIDKKFDVGGIYMYISPMFNPKVDENGNFIIPSDHLDYDVSVKFSKEDL